MHLAQSTLKILEHLEKKNCTVDKICQVVQSYEHIFHSMKKSLHFLK